VYKGNLYMKELVENTSVPQQEQHQPLIISGRSHYNPKEGNSSKNHQNIGTSFSPNKSVLSPNSSFKPNTAIQFRNLSNRINMRNKKINLEGLRSTKYSKGNTNRTSNGTSKGRYVDASPQIKHEIQSKITKF